MIKLAVLEKHFGFFNKSFCGPMRVVYNLCREWEKMKEIELIPLSNALINLFQSRFEPHFSFARRNLLLYRARALTFDIINLHGISRNGTEIANLSKKRQIPIVYTAHGAAYKEKELGYAYPEEFIDQEKKILSIADKVVAVSPEVKELLINKYYLTRDKVNVIYNGIDPNFGRKKYRHVNIRKKYGIPDNRKILLHVGGTRKVKDIPFLIKALELVRRNDWHLILVGPKGEDYENVLRECKSKLGNRYNITGLVTEEELLNFYHQSDLYITTSKYESYGLTILEAMSCGLNVIVRSTIGAAKHLSCNFPKLLERNIFDTPQELAEIITSYLGINQRIEREYLQEILKCNSWENRAKEYLQIFRQLMEK